VAGAGWVAFSSDEGLGDMELAASGQVSILRGSETIAVEDTVSLQPLDLVQTGAKSSARFNLEGDRSIEIGPGSQARVLTVAAVEVAGGSVLAHAGDRIRLIAGEVAATNPQGIESEFRIDRTSSVRTGVYSGNVTLTVPGEPALNIPALHEAAIPVAAPDLPSQPAPYSLDPKDSWDMAELPSVVSLDDDLTNLRNGIADQFGDSRPGLAYFREVAGRDVTFMKPYLKHRPGDVLVGLTVARNVPKMQLDDAFRKGFDLFDRGARWSIAAAIMEAKPALILNSLDSLIDRSGLGGVGGSDPLSEFGDTGGTSGPTGGDVTGTDDGDNPNDGDDETPPPDDDPTTPPPGKDPPKDDDDPKPPPNPPEECSSDIECAIQDVEPPVDNPLEGDVGKGLDIDDKSLTGGS
jgi:hypothetical protein